jgi:uncharacterized phage protein (TIGR01671 family)
MIQAKFRAWDGSKMIYPETTEGSGSASRIYVMDFFGRVSLINQYGLDMEPVEVLPDIILMPFIGLQDKNKKDIYDGDIGRVAAQSGRTEIFVVKWGIHRREMKSGWTVDIPGFCFEVDGHPAFLIVNNYLNGHDLDIIEIIGNIYQNPELLPDKK